MATQFKVEIVTPERVRFDGSADSLTLPGAVGQMGIMAHHAAMVALLDPGVMRVHSPQGETSYATGEGFVQMRNNKATIIVEFAETSDEIQRDDARKALGDAERDLQAQTSAEGRRRVQVAMKAARARLDVVAGPAAPQYAVTEKR